MTAVWRNDPCYFEIRPDKERRCTLGSPWAQACCRPENGAKFFGMIPVTALCNSMLGGSRILYKNLLLRCGNVVLCDQVSHKTPAGCKNSSI